MHYIRSLAAFVGLASVMWYCASKLSGAAKMPMGDTVEISSERAMPYGDRSAVIEQMKTVLASEYVLAAKTQNYHWNVVGMSFKPFHMLYEEQYNALLGIIDAVAERIRALGDIAPGTLAEFIAASVIAEHPGVVPDDRGMAAQLLQDHEAVIAVIRGAEKTARDIEDAASTNFLSGLLEKHEKMAWMLRATVTR